MNQQEIIKFFDRRAPVWDAEMIRDDAVIDAILDNAGVKAGDDVLDVACGTGVLIPDYLQRGVSRVTAVDISPEMIAHARRKFSLPNVHLICADVETFAFESAFDRIIVYNAFPHFFHPARLIEKLAGDLKPGGVLTVAHGMSRASINQHHQNTASSVSIGLMHEDQLVTLFGQYLTVTVKISNERMYQVAGTKAKF